MEEGRTADDMDPASVFAVAEGPWLIGLSFFLSWTTFEFGIGTATFSVLSLLSTAVLLPCKNDMARHSTLWFCLGEARFEQRGWLAVEIESRWWEFLEGWRGGGSGSGSEQLEALGFIDGRGTASAR